MRADGWAALDTASPDAASGMNLTDWLPLGPSAIAYRKLQNEVQMLWHEHPANVEREARGFAAINSFWPWGAATAADVAAPQPALACADAPPWLAAIAQRHGASFAELLAATGQGRAVLRRQPGRSGACHRLGRLAARRCIGSSRTCLRRCSGALAGGAIGKVRLVLSHRNALAEFTTSSLAQRKFWRRPTLDRLLP